MSTSDVKKEKNTAEATSSVIESEQNGEDEKFEKTKRVDENVIKTTDSKKSVPDVRMLQGERFIAQDGTNFVKDEFNLP